jgi:hypothetical protein
MVFTRVLFTVWYTEGLIIGEFAFFWMFDIS